jgi:hypothetical protein
VGWNESELVHFYCTSIAGKKIGRASELLKPDEIIEQVDSRTIAVSPLPCNVKQEDVQSFFTNYAKVCCIYFSFKYYS